MPKILAKSFFSIGDDHFYGTFFAGDKGGRLAISTVGAMLTHEAKQLFEHGFRTMVERLSPKQIIVYGKLPDFIKNCHAEIHSFSITSFAWKNGSRNVSYKETI